VGPVARAYGLDAHPLVDRVHPVSDRPPSHAGERARFESRPADWIGVGEAVARISVHAAPLGVEEVPAADAVGRVLARPLRATATLPPWRNSAMDGYAVRAADVEAATPRDPAVLAVVGRVLAGTAPPREPLRAGEAIRIMTGAPVPDGADAVVRVEDTDAEGEAGRVRVRVPVDAGRHVRPAGEDFREGDELLPAGHEVTPGVVGLAAAAGVGNLAVNRRPTVALVGTGDELRPLERYEEVRRGFGIPESNTPMLAAMIRDAGGRVGPVRVSPDRPEVLAEDLGACRDADVLVTIGGASMGEADLVKSVLDGMGFRQDFWRVRVRPGSPFSFGVLPNGSRLQPVFGLPGNPSSAFVTFELFVRPFLRRLLGHARPARAVLRCVAAEAMTGPGDLAAYLRVAIDHGTPTVARLTGPQGSGLVHGLALADGLAVLPEGVGRVEAGEEVDVMLLGDR